MRFALNTFLVIVAFSLFAVALYVLLSGRHEISLARIILYSVMPASIGLGLLAMLWTTDKIRILLILNGTALAGGILLVELYLQLNPTVLFGNPINQAPKKADVEILWPHLCANSLPLQGLNGSGGSKILPLSGIANNPISFVNVVNGEHKKRNSDEHGFNNPKGLWSQKELELMAIGDSYTFGADVGFDEGFVERLRQWYGTINLGCGGNGPLAELATLIEYGHKLKPKTVVWAYYEGNDLTKDLAKELKNPILRRYLIDSDYSQMLVNRQSEIDAALKAHIESLIQPTISQNSLHVQSRSINWKRLLVLEMLRTALGLTNGYNVEDVETFGDILKRARQITETWGGQIIFVYLPSRTSFTNPIANLDAKGYRTRVMTIVRNAGIKKVLDMHRVFSQHNEPLSLHMGHYTAEGYDMIARELRSVLLMNN